MQCNAEYNQQIINIIKSHPKSWSVPLHSKKNSHLLEYILSNKLKNILEKFDEKLSEAQNMANNGYNRIFDCGNLVFVKIFTKNI